MKVLHRWIMPRRSQSALGKTVAQTVVVLWEVREVILGFKVSLHYFADVSGKTVMEDVW